MSNDFTSEEARSDMLDLVGGRRLCDLVKIPPPPFIFEGMMRDRSLTMVSAKSFVGKSLFMLAQAVAMDYQLKLFGTRSTTRVIKPFIVAGDSPDWDIGSQARKIIKGYGVDPDIATIDGIWRAGNRITDPNFVRWLKSYHSVVGFDVLFFDTLRKAHDGDENKSDVMMKVMDIFQSMRDSMGIAIIVNHHRPKPSKDVIYEGNDVARGSSVIGDSCDFHFGLTRKDNVMTVEVIKGRGGIAADLDRIRLSVDDTPDGGIVFKELRADAESALLAAMQAAGMISRKEACELMRPMFPELNEAQVYKLVDNMLSELKRAGRVSSPMRGQWALSES